MQFPSRSASNFFPVHCVQQQITVGLVMLVVAAVFCLVPEAQAQEPKPHIVTFTPNGFTQQGFATDSNGNPLDGPVEMTFILSRSAEPGSEPLYQETQSVSVNNGQYTAGIGMEEGISGRKWLPEEVFYPGSMWTPSTQWYPSSDWLHTQIEGESLTPAQPVTSTPYSFVSSQLFNQGNASMVTFANASILLNNDNEGDSGEFAIYEGPSEIPLLRLFREGDTPILRLNGNLSVEGTKNFQIDHPTEEGKVLNHYAVESSEVLNTYSGNVTLDEDGTAVVTLPDWFAPINEDPRYTLTPIGAAAPRLHVAEPLANGRFRIAGGPAGLRVSWEVTAVRDDPAARRHKKPVVQDAPDRK